MTIVQAKETFVFEGRTVQAGETFDAAHELVRANPERFAAARPLEDATADPDGRRLL